MTMKARVRGGRLTLDEPTLLPEGAEVELLPAEKSAWHGQVSEARIQRQAKQTVVEMLDRLPENCSLDEILYHLYVIQAVQRGLADAASGRTCSQEELASELRRRWQTPGEQ